MNNKEKRELLAKYKQSYTYYKLTDYQSETDKHTLKGMQELLEILNINYTEVENEVIFEDNKYLIETWKDICGYVRSDMYITFTQDNIEYIINEIKYTSETENQYNARLEVIKDFTNKVKSKGIQAI